MIKIINTWILIKKMRDSVKNVPYVKNKFIHIVLQKNLCYVLKEIMIMNNLIKDKHIGFEEQIGKTKSYPNHEYWVFKE